MLHMIKDMLAHLENPFVWLGLCKFVMFREVFDKWLNDLSIFTSHLKTFKLSVNFWLKEKQKKKKKKWG